LKPKKELRIIERDYKRKTTSMILKKIFRKELKSR